MVNHESTFSLSQTVFPKDSSTVTASSIDEAQLSERAFDLFLSSVVNEKIGLAPTYDKQQRLKSIAFASSSRVLIITFSMKKQILTPNRKLLADRILMNDSLRKYAFHMDKLATYLFTNLSLRVVGAVDILSLVRQSRHLVKTKISALGGESAVHKASVVKLFCGEELYTAEPLTVATQAWVACKAALLHPASAPQRTINTTIFSNEVRPTLPYDCMLFIWYTQALYFLGKTICDAEQLKNLKPIVVENEIEKKYKIKNGELTVQSSRYKTKIMRPGSNQVWSRNR